jgi:hypothetical protein
MFMSMTNDSSSDGRFSKRVMSRQRASVVIKNPDFTQRRIPCLILDSSKEGFRLGGIHNLRRGQVVELVLGESSPSSARCRVVWIGKPGSKQEGEVGLETA